MDTLLKLVIEMRTLLVLLFLTIPWSEARNDKVQRPFDIGHGFHMELAVPGNPGNDYPTLDNIPKTSFSCSGKEPGYYADTETNCQVFRVCTFGSTYGFQSFLCPNGTLFNQAVFVCDWWMNVKCGNSKEMYNYKNELGNLKIGPHFMRDIKKMITHPMRNPYDKTFVKNNVIIMQEYKPPNGQFYNSVSENNSKQNSIKNIAETKGTPQNTFASTTPRTQYYSNFNIYPATSNIVDYFQQQKQRSSFQPNIVNRPAKLQNDFHNERTGQKSPTTSKNILSYTTNLHLLRPTQIYQKILQSEPYINSLYSQTNIQRDQLVNKKQLSTAEQLKLGAQYPKQQLNQHIAQDKELYSSISNQIRHSKDTNNQIETKTKKNLDLVFSFLAESINAAKKYSNIATQNTAISTPTQLRNINSDDSGPIANQVSQLTSAQYSNNKISGNTDIKNDNVRNQQLQGISQIVKPSQQITIKQLSTPVAHLQTSAEPIYSGQLYQLPVPLVTKQFYNSPPQTNAKYTYSNNRLANNIQNERYHIEKRKQIILPKFDIIESKTGSPNSLKPPTDQNQEQFDQGSYANTFLHNIYLPKDGITAQIHDKTIGTIPHPLNKDKLIKYKKNQIYYIHTHLNNNNNASDTQINNDIIYSNLLTQPNREQSNHLSYHLLPSVGYKIEDNKDNQNLLNTLQINEVDKSKQFLRNTYPNHREDISTDVDYIVNHPTTGNSLYNGPSSYYAPQASIGNLELLNTQTNFNANLEKFDTNENNGYPKVRPSKQFIF